MPMYELAVSTQQGRQGQPVDVYVLTLLCGWRFQSFQVDPFEVREELDEDGQTVFKASERKHVQRLPVENYEQLLLTLVALGQQIWQSVAVSKLPQQAYEGDVFFVATESNAQTMAAVKALVHGGQGAWAQVQLIEQPTQEQAASSGSANTM